MTTGINDQYDQMQADIDAIGGPAGGAAPGGPLLPPPGMQQQQQPQTDTAAMMHQTFLMMQNMMQMMQVLQQCAPGMQNAGASSAALRPQEDGHWRQDTHMTNVRFDERAFRRLEKFTNEEDEWKEWRTQLLTAVRECDKGFADALVIFERRRRDQG